MNTQLEFVPSTVTSIGKYRPELLEIGSPTLSMLTEAGIGALVVLNAPRRVSECISP